MITLAAITVFLQAGDPGRGEDPSGTGGVLIVVGIVVVAALAAAAGVLLAMRLLKARREAERAESEPAEQPLPSEEGRAWSSERPRGR